MSNSKKYESGICEHCGGAKEGHYTAANDRSMNGEFCYSHMPHNSLSGQKFKDSGLTLIERNAVRLLGSVEKVFKRPSSNMKMTDTGVPYFDQMILAEDWEELREAVEACKPKSNG